MNESNKTLTNSTLGNVVKEDSKVVQLVQYSDEIDLVEGQPIDTS